jgi:hypothetical protein
MSNPVTLCLIGGSVLAAKFKSAASLVRIVATGRVFALSAVRRICRTTSTARRTPIRPGLGMVADSASRMGATITSAPAEADWGWEWIRWERTPGAAPRGGLCTVSGPPPVVRDGPLRLANANQRLPQFTTRANCGGNCGYVVLAMDSALGGIVLPRRVRSQQFTRIYATSLGPARA